MSLLYYIFDSKVLLLLVIVCAVNEMINCFQHWRTKRAITKNSSSDFATGGLPRAKD